MRDKLADDLERLIRASSWLMEILRVARACHPPDWWVGAGVLRDLVWDGLHGGFDPAHVKDVDLASSTRPTSARSARLPSSGSW